MGGMAIALAATLRSDAAGDTAPRAAPSATRRWCCEALHLCRRRQPAQCLGTVAAGANLSCGVRRMRYTGAREGIALAEPKVRARKTGEDIVTRAVARRGAAASACRPHRATGVEESSHRRDACATRTGRAGRMALPVLPARVLLPSRREGRGGRCHYLFYRFACHHPLRSKGGATGSLPAQRSLCGSDSREARSPCAAPFRSRFQHRHARSATGCCARGALHTLSA